MNIVENPKKVGRIAVAIIIVTLIALAINTFSRFSRGEANESTSMNRLIAKIGVGIIVCTIAFVIGVGAANKRRRNQSTASIGQTPIANDPTSQGDQINKE